MADNHSSSTARPPRPIRGVQSSIARPASRPPPYAVIFRTHFWDEFASRQLRRLQEQVAHGDVYVLVDETRGRVEIPDTERVFRLTDQQVLEAGYVRAGEGSIQWYSGDVPLYLFRETYPDYAYYIQLEYDVNVTVDLDGLVERAAADNVDMIASSRNESTFTWYWLDTCLDAYDKEDVTFRLICLSVFSGSALVSLSRARLQQADRFQAGSMLAWPMCEGFLSTEASKQRLIVRELSEYGNVSSYDFWPPFSERDLERLQPGSFMHPVLDSKRYIPSLLKYEPGLFLLLNPFSWLHRKLWKLGLPMYGRVLLARPFLDALEFAIRRRLHVPRSKAAD